MEKSTSIINISKALVKFKGACPVIPKNSKNPWFKSNYAALPDIQNVIDPILLKHDLIYTQHPEPGDKITTLLIHADSGEFFQSTIDINAVFEYKEEKHPETKQVVWRSDKPYITPQTMGSAITYAKRYAICAILGLNVDDDDDGNAGSGKVPPPAAASQPQQQPTIPQAEKPYLNPDTEKWIEVKVWYFANDKPLNKVTGKYRITAKNQTLLGEKETPKPGSKLWIAATDYLSKKPDNYGGLLGVFNLSDQDATDLRIDAENLAKANKNAETKTDKK